MTGDEDGRDACRRRRADLPHDRIVGAQNQDDRARRPTDDHLDLGRRVAAVAEL
jgi:hypothetical protein